MASRIERELALVVTGKDVSATKTLRGVNREVQNLSKVGGKAATNLGRNIEKGVAIGAVGAAGALAFVTNAAIDFESSSTSVAKTVGDAWREVVQANRELANTIPVDVNTLNAISAAAGAMGIEGAADVNAFTKSIALLSQTADDVDTEIGAEFLGHIRTNMQLGADGIVRMTDLVTHLGNNTASTEGEILAMSEAVSGAAGFIDASVDDVAAWSAAMASAGEEAEAGGSAIQRVWIDSAKFIAEGGDEMKLMAKITGVSMKTFRRSFEQDGAGTLARFMTALGGLTEAEQLAHLEALGWDDIRITRALGKLLANTGNLTGAYEQLGGAAGAAAREAEIRFASTEAQVDILTNNIHDAAITIGQELLPVVNELAGDATEWIREHQPEIKAFAQDLAASVREAVEWGQALDWETIGSSLELAASGAKGIVDAFMGMPDWVKAAVISGWGLNKLTGGAVVDFGKLIFQRGMTPATPMYVSMVGGGMVPGGAPGAAGRAASGGGGLVAGAMKVFMVGAAAGIFAELLNVRVDQANANQAQAAGLVPKAEVFVKSASLEEMKASLAGIKERATFLTYNLTPAAIAYQLDIDGVKTTTEAVIHELEAEITRIEGQAAYRQNITNERMDALRSEVGAGVVAEVAAVERAEAIAGQQAAQTRQALATGATRSELAITRMAGQVTSKASFDSRSEQAAIARAAAAAREAGRANVAALRAKKLAVNFVANVSTSVSVRDIDRQFTYRTKAGMTQL